ncbi:MAG: type II secretion system F family protein [Bdellovibrionia bacterium]
MPAFKYSAIDKSGKLVKGSLEVEDETALRMTLRAQGLRPRRLTFAKKEGALDLGFLSSAQRQVKAVPISVLVGFTRQLQVLVSSGVPLVQALEILLDQHSDSSLKQVISEVKDQVSKGSYLWESLAAYPMVFPRMYIALIKAGEASGSLDTMLKRLSRYLEDADRIAKMVKSAMIYPIGVMSVGAIVVGLMLVFVIPKFEEMLKSSNQELPAPTQFVIQASHFMGDHLLAIVGTIAAVIYIVRRYVKTNEGRYFKDQILFRTPLFGSLLQKGGVARFARTLQTLLASGVNIIDAIEICKNTIDNAVLEDAVGKIRVEIESGKTLGMVISQLTVFPKIAVQMISVGESTGNLDKMLEKLADFYEAEVEILVGGLSKVVEPLILVMLGGLVGGMMIAMYLPVFKLAGGIGE